DQNRGRPVVAQHPKDSLVANFTPRACAGAHLLQQSALFSRQRRLNCCNHLFANTPERRAPISAAALIRRHSIVERRLRRGALLFIELKLFGDLRNAAATAALTALATLTTAFAAAALLRLRFTIARATLTTGAAHERLTLRDQLLVSWAEAHRRVRHAQHVITLFKHDFGVRCHPRQQLPARIVGLDHDCVADNAALSDALLAHLTHAAFKLAIRKRI